MDSYLRLRRGEGLSTSVVSIVPEHPVPVGVREESLPQRPEVPEGEGEDSGCRGLRVQGVLDRIIPVRFQDVCSVDPVSLALPRSLVLTEGLPYPRLGPGVLVSLTPTESWVREEGPSLYTLDRGPRSTLGNDTDPF